MQPNTSAAEIAHRRASNAMQKITNAELRANARKGVPITRSLSHSPASRPRRSWIAFDCQILTKWTLSRYAPASKISRWSISQAAPPSLRCTTVSLGYNISFGVIGGLTPLVATWLVTRTGDEIAPAFLMIASAAVTLIATVSLRETYRSSFTAVASAAAPAYS
jgi:hypothetical protein